VRPAYNAAVPITIRDFKPQDFEVLWSLDQECFPAGISYSRRELENYMQHRGTFTLVAENTDGDIIVGFLVAYGGTTGHIVTIDVSPRTQRTGVGTLLLRAAEERLLADGSKTVGLETAVDNKGALSFYKRHGYKVIRTWPRYYPNGVDALVMTKKLTGPPL
jgi:[ribosomal protein S18]-alanine N-acetyltransferase